MQIIKADFEEEQKPHNLNKFVYINRVGIYIYGKCHNGFPPRLGRPQKYGIATDLFCTGVIGHPGHMFLN